MPLSKELGLGSGHLVLNGDPAPEKGHSSLTLAHVYCGQTAGWIRMPVGTEVGLGPVDIVLDGDQASHRKGTVPPIFGSCLLWPNSCMDQDATWYGGRQQSVTRGLCCPKKGGKQPPKHRPMSTVAKPSLILAT